MTGTSAQIAGAERERERERSVVQRVMQGRVIKQCARICENFLPASVKEERGRSGRNFGARAKEKR